VVVTASQAAINTTLAGIGGLIYRGTLNFNGSDTLTVNANDLSNTGSGGPLFDSHMVGITITAVNDAPVNGVPGAQTVNEDNPLVFSSANGNAITVSDPDAGTNPLLVTLTSTNGTLIVTATGSGASVSGSGSASVTLTGTLTQINAALAGLTFNPPADYNGPASVRIQVTDQGATGVGGPMTDDDTIAITVLPVNDDPMANDDSFTFNQDAGAQVLDVLGNDSSAPDGVETLTITVLSPASGGGSVTIINGGTAIQYTPAAGFSGTETFTYTISDGNGGMSTATVTISVTPAPPPPPSLLVTGTDAGAPPHVKVYDARTGQLKFSFMAYDPSFLGGVRVATADVNGDGIADIITGSGVGATPHVKVFDGQSGGLIASFLAYDGTFPGGVFVAGGDVDGFADIITGAGAGGPGGHVKIFSGRDQTLLASYFAFDSTFVGGVSVAAGDVDGDGRADVIVGAGAGSPGGHVKVFSGAGQVLLASFLAYDLAYSGGVFVSAGDTDGDGKAEITTGAALLIPNVKVFGGMGDERLSFFAYAPAGTPIIASNTQVSGVRVGMADTDGDGKAEIITSSGPGQRLPVQKFRATTSELLDSFFAYDPTFSGGIFVSGF
jgi:Bacterial Ig domain/Bacterial cadherin-like domain/FG-GAP repeat